MEEQWYADRAALRHLLRTHPEWTHRELATQIGRSRGWVKKWCKRLRAAPAQDCAVLHGQPRLRRTPYHQWDARVIARILDIREQPPEHLRRTPGPKAILYYLHRDPDLQAAGLALPRSPNTIWRILTRHGYIARRRPPHHEPVERPAPLTAWQLDFKDASTVAADPDGLGKRQHVVEVLNTVDTGTSLLVAAQVHDRYTAATSLAAVADLLREQGRPDGVTFDRDPRFVGGPHARDFPAPFVRFWLCLGVNVTICPPHHPQTNGFVERYNRSYTEECLRVEHPATVEEVRGVTALYREHYNWERPNQALSCRNRPPRVAFPDLPARPSVPLVVDPDAWLRAVNGRGYVRRVRDNGTVTVDRLPYYVGRDFYGQDVALVVEAATGEFVVVHGQTEVKRMPIKGLVGQLLPFDTFVEVLQRQAQEDYTVPVTSSA